MQRPSMLDADAVYNACRGRVDLDDPFFTVIVSRLFGRPCKVEAVMYHPMVVKFLFIVLCSKNGVATYHMDPGLLELVVLRKFCFVLMSCFCFFFLTFGVCLQLLSTLTSWGVNFSIPLWFFVAVNVDVTPLILR
jgi:hypothetical protein